MYEFFVILLVVGEWDWLFKVVEKDWVGFVLFNYGVVYFCV